MSHRGKGLDTQKNPTEHALADRGVLDEGTAAASLAAATIPGTPAPILPSAHRPGTDLVAAGAQLAKAISSQLFRQQVSAPMHFNV